MRALQCQCACLQFPAAAAAAVLLPVNSWNNGWSCSSSSSWRVCNGNPAIAVGVSTLFSQPITSAEQVFLKTKTTTTTTMTTSMTQSGREVRRGFSRRASRRRFITPRLVADYSEAGVTGTAGNGRGVLLTEEAGTEAVRGGGDSLLSTVGTPSPLPSPRTLSPADQQLVGMYFTACLVRPLFLSLSLSRTPCSRIDTRCAWPFQTGHNDQWRLPPDRQAITTLYLSLLLLRVERDHNLYVPVQCMTVFFSPVFQLLKTDPLQQCVSNWCSSMLPIAFVSVTSLSIVSVSGNRISGYSTSGSDPKLDCKIFNEST